MERCSGEAIESLIRGGALDWGGGLSKLRWVRNGGRLRDIELYCLKGMSIAPSVRFIRGLWLTSIQNRIDPLGCLSCRFEGS